MKSEFVDYLGDEESNLLANMANNGDALRTFAVLDRVFVWPMKNDFAPKEMAMCTSLYLFTHTCLYSSVSSLLPEDEEERLDDEGPTFKPVSALELRRAMIFRAVVALVSLGSAIWLSYYLQAPTVAPEILNALVIAELRTKRKHEMPIDVNARRSTQWNSKHIAS